MTESKPRVIQSGGGRTYAVAGGLYTIKASAEDTGGAYALIEMFLPVGSGPALHVHSRESESFYLLQGELTFWVDNKEFTAGEGAFIQAPPGLPHSFKNLGAGPVLVLMLAVPAGIETFFAEVGVPVEDKAPLPAAPPDLEKVKRAAAKYGITMQA